MLIVHVFVEVKPDYLEAFLAATIENAKHSLMEPGIARFDVLQCSDKPTQIILNEVYRKKEDTVKHRETPHYQAWKERVEVMIAAPRTKQIYNNIIPDENGWE